MQCTSHHEHHGRHISRSVQASSQPAMCYACLFFGGVSSWRMGLLGQCTCGPYTAVAVRAASTKHSHVILKRMLPY